MSHILVLGDANADLTATIGQFPVEGDDCGVLTLGWGGGGMAVNVAVALARLGAPARLLARVGQDPVAEAALRAARDAGVDLSAVQLDPLTATGLCFAAISPGGERTFFAFRGANTGYDAGPDVLRAAQWLHLTGHALLEGAQRASALRLIYDRPAGLPASLDLCLPLIRVHREQLLTLLPAFDLLLLNEQEARALLPDVPEEQAAEALLARGARRVALKLGRRGCVLADPALRHVQPGFAVDAVDSNGCGDAFGAALITALLDNQSLPRSATRACAAGALAATSAGAAESLPSAAALAAFLAERLP